MDLLYDPSWVKASQILFPQIEPNSMLLTRADKLKILDLGFKINNHEQMKELNQNLENLTMILRNKL